MNTKVTNSAQKVRPYFFGEVSIDADIARHRKQEEVLREKLANYEKNPIKNAAIISTYKSFLVQLLQSKSLVASKIGRK